MLIIVLSIAAYAAVPSPTQIREILSKSCGPLFYQQKEHLDSPVSGTVSSVSKPEQGPRKKHRNVNVLLQPLILVGEEKKERSKQPCSVGISDSHPKTQYQSQILLVLVSGLRIKGQLIHPPLSVRTGRCYRVFGNTSRVPCGSLTGARCRCTNERYLSSHWYALGRIEHRQQPRRRRSVQHHLSTWPYPVQRAKYRQPAATAVQWPATGCAPIVLFSAKPATAASQSQLRGQGHGEVLGAQLCLGTGYMYSTWPYGDP